LDASQTIGLFKFILENVLNAQLMLAVGFYFGDFAGDILVFFIAR